MTQTPVPTAADEAARSARVGLLLGIGAYGMWGFFPLFFPLLEPASALEILADRFLFSLVFMALLLTLTRTWSRLRPVLPDRRRMLLLLAASALIGVNWGLYIWGVNNGHVVEGSLGYFINPLVLVLMGVVVLGERLRRLQWVAVGIAAVAVVVLTLGYGKLPWLALSLAFSFAGYGLVKKVAGVDPQAALTIETAYATPFALAYLVLLGTQGTLTFGHSSGGNTALLVLTGAVTAIPLLMFGGAANRIPLSTVGLLQYLTPVIQFVIGVWVVGEQMPPARWAGFAVVWVALAVFTIDLLRHSRSARMTAAQVTGIDEVEAPV
ncbi:MAG: EamA family transporter RarD [Frankiales bacterium]|nr:EamA family transporter RarD [Frankiales bacterium]